MRAAATLLAVLALAGGALAHDDDADEDLGRRAPAAASSPQYRKECGSCHVAYPPGLLPARSWTRLMGGLGDHFGESAELPDATRAALTTWLEAQAGGRRVPAAETPLRITETRFFRREHDEIPARLVRDNPEVKTFARCNACHADASDGRFDEHTVRIPGHGRWDD